MNKLHLILFILFYPCMSLSMEQKENNKEYGDKYRIVIAHKNDPENKPELLTICKDCSFADSDEPKTLFEKISLFRFLIKETILFHANENKIKRIKKLIDKEEKKFFPDFYVCEMEKCIMRPIS